MKFADSERIITKFCTRKFDWNETSNYFNPLQTA